MLVEFSEIIDQKNRIGCVELNAEARQVYQKKLGEVGLILPEASVAIGSYTPTVQESNQRFSAPEFVLPNEK